MIINGEFISIWDGGTVHTSASLDTESGEVTTTPVEVADMGSLIREEFEASNGDEYKVCTTCHSYILKGKMVPDNVGNGLHEEQLCADPNCESHEEE